METQEEFTYKQAPYPNHPNNYRITCFDVNKAYAGHIWFEVRPRKLVLHYVGVKKQYRRKHIGSTLLHKMEDFAKKNHIYHIEGKFDPDNEKPEEKLDLELNPTRRFYEYNGYTVPNAEHSWVNYDETWTLYKDLHPTVLYQTNHMEGKSK